MAVPIAELITSLPQILQFIQVFSYIVFVLFFGSIAIKGWKGAPSWLVKVLLRLGAGFVCLIGGITFGPWVPWPMAEMMKLFQIDMIVMGLVVSVIMAIGVALISNNLPGAVQRFENRIRKLQEKLRRIQETGARGVTPQRVVGAVIILVVVVLSAMYFPGFPDMSEELFSTLGPMVGGEGGPGVDIGQLTQMSESCTNALASMAEIQQVSPELLMTPEVYTSPALKSLIESETGDGVIEMYKIEYQANVIIYSLMDSGRRCLSTDKEFCLCVDVEQA